MRSDSAGARGGVRAVVLHVRNRLTHAAHTSEPLALNEKGGNAKGIAIGRETCHLDPLVSASHGTLECTPQHGVWVYVDHSERGSTLNGKRLVHRDAAIVRDGDVLSLGNTEITLAFQVHAAGDDLSSNNNQLHASPPLHPQPLLASQIAKQQLPHIQTAPRAVQQPPPEYINSPIPGSNWRKKRHSISHVTTRMPVALGVAASTSTSQTFSRSKPLVPSAPTTPPQKDAPARHVSHHVAASHSPQSQYFHVKFKEEPETIAAESIAEDDVQQQQDEDEEEQQQSQPALMPSPPLEYSSSPVTTPSLLNRGQHPPAPPTLASTPVISTASKSSPPFAQHATHQNNPPAKVSNRPMDLRIQVAKRNAGLASAAAAARPFAAGATTTPTASNVNTATTATRPAILSRGITIPTSIVPPSHNQARRFPCGSGLEGLTPPASPVAQQDILRQQQSLLNILKSKFKQEQKLKREQEEWMRSQFPASSPSTVPSMSPIRHDKDGNRENGDDNADSGLVVPPKAPALLRTVSLGHTHATHGHFHQPSPRLTQAVLASRARKGSFDGSRHGPLGGKHHTSPRDDLHLLQGHARHRSSSGDSSVTSSVSTEPANYRRVMRSMSFSSRAASSGELSDFLGYDDDATDGLLSFTSFFGGGGGTASSSELLDETLKRSDAQLNAASSRKPTASLLHHRNRAPSLDDEMAGVLNSPSHASTSLNRFRDPHAFASRITSGGPLSVAKPRPRSADVRKADKPHFRRPHQLGVDLERSPTHA